MKAIEKDGNDTVDIIKCPHCEHLMAYDDLIDVGYMSGNFDMDCEKCKRLSMWILLACFILRLKIGDWRVKNPFEESVKKLATEGLYLLLEDIKHRIRDALLSENQSYLQQQQQRVVIVKKKSTAAPCPER